MFVELMNAQKYTYFQIQSHMAEEIHCKISYIFHMRTALWLLFHEINFKFIHRIRNYCNLSEIEGEEKSELHLNSLKAGKTVI